MPFRLGPGSLALVTFVTLNGCDAGEAPLVVGPQPRLLAYEPQAGVGMDCDLSMPGCGFPVNRPLSFTLDRWLLPTTATRQGIQVGLAGTDSYVHWDPQYDIIRRTITFAPEWNWDLGYLFDLRLYDPREPVETAWGFRSYDGQLLDRRGVPEHILFRVGSPEQRAPEQPHHTSCKQALFAFAAAGCSASRCHSAAAQCTGSDACRWVPRAGLALDSASGLQATLRRVARATDRAGLSGKSRLSGERFGWNMPIVEPGEPSFSFIVYRILLGRDAYRDETGKFIVRPPPAEELERARDWFGVVEEMPPPDVGWPQLVSPIGTVTTLHDWIRDGATTTDCE